MSRWRNPPSGGRRKRWNRPPFGARTVVKSCGRKVTLKCYGRWIHGISVFRDPFLAMELLRLRGGNQC